MRSMVEGGTSRGETPSTASRFPSPQGEEHGL